MASDDSPTGASLELGYLRFDPVEDLLDMVERRAVRIAEALPATAVWCRPTSPPFTKPSIEAIAARIRAEVQSCRTLLQALQHDPLAPP